MNHKMSPMARALGLIEGMKVSPITARTEGGSVRLVNGHTRALAAVELGLPFTVQIDGLLVQMLKQKDGAIAGTLPDGSRVTMKLEP